MANEPVKIEFTGLGSPGNPLGPFETRTNIKINLVAGNFSRWEFDETDMTGSGSYIRTDVRGRNYTCQNRIEYHFVSVLDDYDNTWKYFGLKICQKAAVYCQIPQDIYIWRHDGKYYFLDSENNILFWRAIFSDEPSGYTYFQLPIMSASESFKYIQSSPEITYDGARMLKIRYSALLKDSSITLRCTNSGVEDDVDFYFTWIDPNTNINLGKTINPNIDVPFTLGGTNTYSLKNLVYVEDLWDEYEIVSPGLKFDITDGNIIATRIGDVSYYTPKLGISSYYDFKWDSSRSISEQDGQRVYPRTSKSVYLKSKLTGNNVARLEIWNTLPYIISSQSHTFGDSSGEITVSVSSELVPEIPDIEILEIQRDWTFVSIDDSAHTFTINVPENTNDSNRRGKIKVRVGDYTFDYVVSQSGKKKSIIRVVDDSAHFATIASDPTTPPTQSKGYPWTYFIGRTSGTINGETVSHIRTLKVSTSDRSIPITVDYNGCDWLDIDSIFIPTGRNETAVRIKTKSTSDYTDYIKNITDGTDIFNYLRIDDGRWYLELELYKADLSPRIATITFWQGESYCDFTVIQFPFYPVDGHIRWAADYQFGSSLEETFIKNIPSSGKSYSFNVPSNLGATGYPESPWISSTYDSSKIYASIEENPGYDERLGFLKCNTGNFIAKYDANGGWLTWLGWINYSQRDVSGFFENGDFAIFNQRAKSYIYLDKTEGVYSGSGLGYDTLSAESNYPGELEITSSPWIHTTRSVSGDFCNIRLTLDSNTSTSRRNGFVKVSCDGVEAVYQVEQRGAPQIDIPSSSYKWRGGETTVHVSIDYPGDTISIINPSSFIVVSELVAPTYGVEPGEYKITVLENTTTTSMTGTVRFSIGGTSEAIHTVQLKGRPTIKVSPTSLTSYYPGGTYDFTITTTNFDSPEDIVSYSNTLSWCTVDSLTNTSARITVSPSELTTTRTGKIKFIADIAEAEVLVEQRGIPTISITPDIGNYIAVGESKNVSISTTNFIRTPYYSPILAISTDSWVSVKVNDDYSATITVIGNPSSSPRDAEITFKADIAEATYRLHQEKGFITLTASSGHYNASGETKTIGVLRSSKENDITATSSDGWVSLDISNVSDTIKISVEGNTTPSQREATVVVKCGELETTYSIVQEEGFLRPSPEVVNVPFSGTSRKVVSISRSSQIVDVIATPSVPWITAEVDNSRNEVYLGVSRLLDSTERTGTVILNLGELEAEITVNQMPVYVRTGQDTLTFGPQAETKSITIDTNWDGEFEIVSSHPSKFSASINSAKTSVSVSTGREDSGNTLNGTVDIIIPGITSTTVQVVKASYPRIEFGPGTENPLQVGSSSSKQKVNVSAILDGESQECTVSSDVSWLNPSWQGGELTVNVSSNDEYTPRTGNITISAGGNSKTLTIQQEESYYIYVDPSQKGISAAGEEFDVICSTNWKGEISILNKPAWTSVEKTGDRIFHITVLENNSDSNRGGNIIFQAANKLGGVVINQLGKNRYSVSLRTVSENGIDILGTEIKIYKGTSEDGELVYHTTTQGGTVNYSYIGEASEPFYCTATKSGWTKGEKLVQSSMTGEYIDIVLKEIKTWYVNLSAKDQFGEPVEGIEYTLLDEGGNEITGTGSSIVSYSYLGTSPQQFSYTLKKFGYNTLSGTVISSLDSTPVDVVIEKKPIAQIYSIRLVVIDSTTGENLSGVGYTIRRVSTGETWNGTSSGGYIDFQDPEKTEQDIFFYELTRSEYSSVSGSILSSVSQGYSSVEMTPSTTSSNYISLSVKDTSGNPIGGAEYVIRSGNSSGYVVSQGTTPSTGRVQFPVSPGTYYYILNKLGYTGKGGIIESSTNPTLWNEIVLQEEKTSIVLSSDEVNLARTPDSAVIGYTTSGSLSPSLCTIDYTSPEGITAELDTTNQTITISNTTTQPNTVYNGTVRVRFVSSTGEVINKLITVFFNSDYISSGISEWRPGTAASEITTQVVWSSGEIPTIVSSNPSISAEWESTSSGSGTLKISVPENTNPSERKGTITLSTVSDGGKLIQKEINVSQDGTSEYTFSVNINVVDSKNAPIQDVSCELYDDTGRLVFSRTGSSFSYQYFGNVSDTKTFVYRLRKNGFVPKDGEVQSSRSGSTNVVVLDRTKSIYYCNILVLDRYTNERISGATWSIKNGDNTSFGTVSDGNIYYSIESTEPETIYATVEKIGYTTKTQSFTTSLDNSQKTLYLSDDSLDITFPGEEYPYYGSAEVIKYSITKGTATDVKVVSQSPWISKVSVDLEGKTVRFTTTDNTTVGYRSGSITISFYDPARSGWVDFVVPIKQAGYDSEGRIYIPTWANTYVEIPSSSYWTVEADGEVIYSGRTAVEPGKTKAVVEVSGIFKNYIKPTMDFGDTGTVVDNNEDKSFKIYAYSGSGSTVRKTQVAEFMAHNDWSYDASMNYNTKNSDGIILSEPVNGHFDYRMYFLFTGYQSGPHPGAWYSYVKRSGEFLDYWEPSFGSVGGNYTHTFEISGVSPNATSVHFDNPDIQSGITYDKPVCGCKYALYYRNRKGGFDSFLIEGSSKVIDNIDRYTTESVYSSRNPIEFGTKNYNKSITSKYELNTGFLRDEEAKRLAFNLIPSPQVWLHNLETDEISSVVITNSEAEYKTWKTESNKLVSYKLTVERSQKRNFL